MYVCKLYMNVYVCLGCCRTKVRTTFKDFYPWLGFVLASPVPPGLNVDCDLPLIWCGHFLDKSSHRPKHTCANIDFWGAGGTEKKNQN